MEVHAKAIRLLRSSECLAWSSIRLDVQADGRDNLRNPLSNVHSFLNSNRTRFGSKDVHRANSQPAQRRVGV